jgi:hypothetical protein
VVATQYFTLFWGIVAIGFACVSSLFENLIQLVNIIGSIFYGTVLGIFLIGFYFHYIKGKAAFYSGLISQTIVILIFLKYILFESNESEKLGYLWLNLIGVLLTICIAFLLQKFFRSKA